MADGQLLPRLVEKPARLDKTLEKTQEKIMSCRTAADLSRHFGDPHGTIFLLGSADCSIINDNFQGVQWSFSVDRGFLGVLGELLTLL